MASGRSTIKTRISLDGGRELEAQLKALGKTGEQAFSQIQKAALKVNLAPLTTSVRKFGSELAAFGKRASLALAGFGLIGGVSLAGTTKALANLATAAGEVADQTGKAAEKAGLSVEAFSKLAFAAEQSDVSQEQLITSFSRLNKQLSAAAGGNKTAVSLFKQLGVAIKDSQGRLRPTEDIIHDIADAFARMPNGVKKSTLALQLFGKSGAALIPFLNEGKAGLLDLEKQAEQLGITLTEQQSKIGDALGDSLDKVSKAAAGIRLQLGLAFAPALTKAADTLTQRIIANRKQIVAFGEDLAKRVGPVVDDVINALSGNDSAVKNSAIIQLRDQTVQFGTAVQQSFTQIIIPAFNGLRDVLDGVADVMNNLFGTNVSGDALGIAIAIGSLTGAFKLLRAAIDVVLAGLILLTRHPVVAALTAIAAGLVVVANKMHLGETAADAHKRALDELKTAVDNVKNGVPGAQQRLNELARSHLDAATSATTNAQAQVDAALKLLQIEKERVKAAADVPGGESNPLAKGLLENQLKRIEQEEQRLVETNIELARSLRRQEEIQAAISGKSIDKIEDLRGSADTATKSVAQIGDAAAKTEKQVEELGRSIKVTSFGGGGRSKKLFDIDSSGFAKAREDVSGVTSSLGDAEDQAEETATAITDIGDAAEGSQQRVEKLGITVTRFNSDGFKQQKLFPPTG